jgi:alpha-tubulin suppressor-like RCC1 family protein
MYFKTFLHFSAVFASIALTAAPGFAANSTRTRLVAVSPSPVGSPVTLTAEVDAPAGVGAATGRVSFTDGVSIPGWASVSLSGAGQAVLAGGWLHNCVLASPTGVRCWGYNSHGQLGDGSTTDRATPVPVAGLTARAVALAVGVRHSCALTIKGAVECWGDNGVGQLGAPKDVGKRLAPAPVPGLSSGVVAIAAGYMHSCAVTVAGAIQCWGDNSDGQLGNGEAGLLAPPSPLGGPAHVYVDVAAGELHSCGLLKAGAVLCWGRGFGNVPTPVAGADRSIVAVTAAAWFGCVLTKTGAVKCWKPYWNDPLVAEPVAGLSSGVVAIASGMSHVCALLSGGGVRCWGSNKAGQLGDGTTADRLTPTPVKNLGGPAVAISAGWDHSCALLATRVVKCWGYNEFGEIGDGSMTNRPLPVAVSGLSALLRGRARLTTSTLAPGLHSLRANYLGDAAHSPSQSAPLPLRIK